MKTWISEETGPEATIEALLSVIPYFRISVEQAREILSRMDLRSGQIGARPGSKDTTNDKT